MSLIQYFIQIGFWPTSKIIIIIIIINVVVVVDNNNIGPANPVLPANASATGFSIHLCEMVLQHYIDIFAPRKVCCDTQTHSH